MQPIEGKVDYIRLILYILFFVFDNANSIKMTNLSELLNALSSMSYLIFSSASDPGEGHGDGLDPT